jgi:hypothetical protein
LFTTWYSWNTAKVDVKHQWINHDILLQLMSIINQWFNQRNVSKWLCIMCCGQLVFLSIRLCSFGHLISSLSIYGLWIPCLVSLHVCYLQCACHFSYTWPYRSGRPTLSEGCIPYFDNPGYLSIMNIMIILRVSAGCPLLLIFAYKTMFGSYLPPLVCTSIVVSNIYGVMFCVVFLRLVYPILPVSLDCPFLIAPSVFSSGY